MERRRRGRRKRRRRGGKWREGEGKIIRTRIRRKSRKGVVEREED